MQGDLKREVVILLAGNGSMLVTRSRTAATRDESFLYKQLLEMDICSSTGS